MPNLPPLDDLKKNYFELRALQFLSDLRSNNNKPWFDENRKHYEEYVKEPFKTFLNALQAAIMRYDKKYAPQKPHKIAFRISRDTRFSKDKTPYKPHMSAFFSHKGRSKDYPGSYLQIDPDRVMVGGGIYGLQPKPLASVRHFVYDNREEFRSIIEDSAFLQTFGEVRGEQNKVLPKDLKEKAEAEPLLYNKGWYVMTMLPAELVTSEELIPTIIEKMMLAEPLTDFFRRAMGDGA